MNEFNSPQEIDAYLASIPRERIVARECKHATYSKHRGGELSDMLTVKEWVTLDDGQRLPTLKTIQDYERPYWVTKPHLRNHPDKIQFEDLKSVDRYKSTQIALRRDVCFRLGRGDPSKGIRTIARSPYVYGLDPGPEVFLKQQYLARFPEAVRPNHVKVIDAETDVRESWMKPILWSEVDHKEIVVYVNKKWAHDFSHYADDLREEYYSVLDQWLDQIRKKLTNKKDGKYPAFLDDIVKIPLRIVELPDHDDITMAMVQNLHNTQPDIVTGWNVYFDACRMTESLQRGGYDPADVLSDPRVPYEYKSVFLKEGSDKQRTASGRERNLDPQERWNVMLHSASWRMLDAMQCYWQLRKAKGKESGGYGLDAILTRHLGVGKLKYATEDTNVPGGTIHWHMDMQDKYKVRYGCYNIFDSLGVWIMDTKNQDLASQISSLSGACDYSRFHSQPTVNSIDMLFSVLKRDKKIICSTSDQMSDELDTHLLGLEDWIVTFPSHIVEDSGLNLYENLPDTRSLIHMFASDADVETTYPTAEIIQNISKETTMAEPCRIEGVGREAQRFAGINLTAGLVNSVEIVESVCKAPKLDDWVELAKKEMQ